MQHIIEEHKRLELKIDMMASYVVIPHGGFYRKYEFILSIYCIKLLSIIYIISSFRNESLLVFNLGCLKIKSKPHKDCITSIQEMHKMGASQTEVLQEIVNRSYDRYYIELENAQV